jgi:hypothetical protein
MDNLKRFYILKTIVLDSEDIQQLLSTTLSTQDLCDELFKRDADFIVNSLVESKKQELLASLFKDQPATPALVEELKHQLKRCDALELDFSKETLLTYIRYLDDLYVLYDDVDPDIYEKIEDLCKTYQLDFSTFIKGQDINDANLNRCFAIHQC